MQAEALSFFLLVTGEQDKTFLPIKYRPPDVCNCLTETLFHFKVKTYASWSTYNSS